MKPNGIETKASASIEATADGLLALVDAADASRHDEERVNLSGGRSLHVRRGPNGETVTLRGKGQRTELVIEIGEHGARVKLEAADLELSSPGKVEIDCDAFAVKARRVDLEASESAHIVAADAELRATTGDLLLQANDDLKAKGERVLLNSDGPAEVPRWMKEQLQAMLGPPPTEVTLPLSSTSGDESLLDPKER